MQDVCPLFFFNYYSSFTLFSFSLLLTASPRPLPVHFKHPPSPPPQDSGCGGREVLVTMVDSSPLRYTIPSHLLFLQEEKEIFLQDRVLAPVHTLAGQALWWQIIVV